VAESKFEFYECNNPDCRLRFPGYDGYPKSKRCPACRSTIHVAESMIDQIEISKTGTSLSDWKLEALLDNIRSTWNVGSIFRTSDGIGVQKLFLCGITPTPENTKIGKTALGAELTIPWERHNNGVQLAKSLISQDYQLWALEDLPAAVPLYEITDLPKKSPLALIVGNEVCGIDPGIIEYCDKVISIPMLGKKKSYNVAVAYGMAASFLLYRHNVSHGSRSILPNT
jgi:23S rRNA (guanosine2251-2'-O)-methyltransferase